MSCASSSWLAKAAPAAALFRGRDKGALREIESERPPLPRIIRRGSATLIELAPSILSANFAQLGSEALAAVEGGGTVLHLDVMDGHFVPNLTIGPPVVASLRKTISKVPFDCHLMIENPHDFIPPFPYAPANCISLHRDPCTHLT